MCDGRIALGAILFVNTSVDGTPNFFPAYTYAAGVSTLTGITAYGGKIIKLKGWSKFKMGGARKYFVGQAAAIDCGGQDLVVVVWAPSAYLFEHEQIVWGETSYEAECVR